MSGKGYQLVRQSVLKFQDEVMKAVPEHIGGERLIRVFLSTVSRSPKLQECTQDSLIASLLEAAALGLEPDGLLGQAYLIPYGKKCTLQVGYKGLMNVARRSGAVWKMVPRTVYTAEEFEVLYGSVDTLHHRPVLDEKARGDATHYYAVAWFPDSTCQFTEPWTLAKMQEHRDRYSKSYKNALKKLAVKGIEDWKRKSIEEDTPWISNFEAMSWKTMLVQLCKFLPQSTEMGRALYVAERSHDAPPIVTVKNADVVVDLKEPEPNEPPDESNGEGEPENEAPAKPPGEGLY